MTKPRQPIQSDRSVGDHRKKLERPRERTGEYAPPPETCGTWNALDLGHAELERELMKLIHTENSVHSSRALCGGGTRPSRTLSAQLAPPAARRPGVGARPAACARRAPTLRLED